MWSRPRQGRASVCPAFPSREQAECGVLRKTAKRVSPSVRIIIRRGRDRRDRRCMSSRKNATASVEMESVAGRAEPALGSTRKVIRYLDLSPLGELPVASKEDPAWRTATELSSRSWKTNRCCPGCRSSFRPLSSPEASRFAQPSARERGRLRRCSLTPA